MRRNLDALFPPSTTQSARLRHATYSTHRLELIESERTFDAPRSRDMAHPQHAPPFILADGEIEVIERAPSLERFSWALYDFANTIFSMNVATLYFAVWLVSDLGVSNTMDAAANAVASLLVVLSIPFLGALSDSRRRRKAWVVGFTILSCVALAVMGYLGQTVLPLTG